VKKLKQRYDECQVCGIKHFETYRDVLYSEVHHLISWKKSHDDSRENLVVVCPTCHKKFDHAKNNERTNMYQILIKNYLNIMFKRPDYVS